ncbi:MAG: hypothetical protein JKY45_01160 [Emcibacter sp.]|nr:hypothetical protein [Emcibacter sp.]
MSKFSRIIKISVFTLGLAIFGLAPAAQAIAEHKYNNHYNKHAYNKHNNNHNYNRRHNRPSYNKYSSNRYYYGKRHHNRHHNSHGGDVALGVLTGGLLFYALTANQRRNTETIYVQQQQPVYVQPAQQQWTGRQPVQVINNSCLQVREYQTTITVGGQTVPAYGQSCLQADGSWKLGPATPEPGF